MRQDCRNPQGEQALTRDRHVAAARRSSIAAILEDAASRGDQLWTSRVVSDDGALGTAVHAHGQLTQLQREGIPLSGPSQVDLARCPPGVL